MGGKQDLTPLVTVQFERDRKLWRDAVRGGLTLAELAERYNLTESTVVSLLRKQRKAAVKELAETDVKEYVVHCLEVLEEVMRAGVKKVNEKGDMFAGSVAVGAVKEMHSLLESNVGRRSFKPEQVETATQEVQHYGDILKQRFRIVRGEKTTTLKDGTLLIEPDDTKLVVEIDLTNMKLAPPPGVGKA